nr:putative transposase En/Spm [Ipomoea batatas]
MFNQFYGLRQYNPGATNEEIDQEVERSFANWFRDYVYNPANNVGNQALIDLACGPLMQVTTYNGKSTNNFGVSIKGTSLSHGDSLFFGTLKEIVEVEYPNIPLKKVVLFNCEWFDPTPNTGTKLNSDSGLAEVHSRKRPRGTIDNAYKHIETYQQDIIHVPTNDVSVVQDEVEELLHVLVVLTEVNVHPISGPDELDDQNEIEDDGEETDQEVVLEDTDDGEDEAKVYLLPKELRRVEKTASTFFLKSPAKYLVVPQCKLVGCRYDPARENWQYRDDMTSPKITSRTHYHCLCPVILGVGCSSSYLLLSASFSLARYIIEVDKRLKVFQDQLIDGDEAVQMEKYYRWDPLEENIVRRIFEKKGAKLLTDHLREVRVRLVDKSKTKPHWIADDVLDDLVRIWKSEDFKKVSEKNKSNRNSNSGGLGASLHSCGSIPMTEHHRRLKEKLGKDPSLADLYQHTHKRKNGDGAYVCAKAQKVLDTMNELRQTQTEASDVELWLEATDGVKRGGYVYGFGSDTQHYFPAASKKSKSQAGASSSNAALMAEIQEMREENKMFREENKFIREELSNMGAIFAQLSANPEFLSSLNLNNSGSQNDETQAYSDED